MYHLEEYYLYLKEKLYAQKTIIDHKQVMNRFINYLKKKKIKHLQSITMKLIKSFAFKNTEIKEGSSWYYLYKLRGYFRFLEYRKYIFSSPFNDFKKKYRPYSSYETLSQKEIEDILSKIRTDTDFLLRGKTILELMYSTAMRPQEVIALKISQINFENNMIFIKQSKFKKDRLIPVGDYALIWIRKYLSVTRARINTDNDYLFVNQKNGNPLSIFNLNHAIKETLRKSGLRTITPYSMRSTTATVLYKNGMDLAYLRKLLGHERITTTKGYLKIDDEDLKVKIKKYHPRNKFKIKEIHKNVI